MPADDASGWAFDHYNPDHAGCAGTPLVSLPLAGLFLVSLSLISPAFAQTTPQVQAAAAKPEVKAAMARLDQNRPQLLELWKKLALTSAPSGHEEERAALVMSELKRLGYTDAYRDAAGNVISAPIAKDARITAFVAHLDTVVQPGVKVTITEGKNAKGNLTWTGPGVGDDASGVVALLGVMEAIASRRPEPAECPLGLLGE